MMSESHTAPTQAPTPVLPLSVTPTFIFSMNKCNREPFPSLFSQPREPFIRHNVLQVLGVCYLPNGTLATASWDKTVKMWEISSCELKCTRTLTGHTEWVSSPRILCYPLYPLVCDMPRQCRRVPSKAISCDISSRGCACSVGLCRMLPRRGHAGQWQ